MKAIIGVAAIALLVLSMLNSWTAGSNVKKLKLVIALLYASIALDALHDLL